MLNAFEKLNKVQITIIARVVERNKKADLLYQASAMPADGWSPARDVWDSPSAICWGSDFKSLMGAVTTLLYRLDFQLAEIEQRNAY